jgi:hypothetical protein
MTANGRQPVKMPSSSLPVGVLKQRALSANFVHPFVPEAERIPLPTNEHFHWSVAAFAWFDEETGGIFDQVVVNVEAADEQAAIDKAMQIVERPIYRVSSVSEACSWDKH